MTTFSDRPGYQRISSSLWKQREDYCASLIQKAWKFHKLRNTDDPNTEDPHTGDEEDYSFAAASAAGMCLPTDSAAGALSPSLPGGVTPGSGGGGKTVKLPPIHPESKHLIEVRSADEEES